ncbi:hypothetical protein [Nakamurella antarctica]|uniref:hypothetical protein n=1 Tax=Nakamurella antarctica TaxID=1902245 RepID=UPI0019CFB364|nr:hypothetical protein [Nakamurella antarctica]
MKISRMRISAIVAAAGITLLLAGCGAKDDASASANAAAAAASSAFVAASNGAEAAVNSVNAAAASAGAAADALSESAMAAATAAQSASAGAAAGTGDVAPSGAPLDEATTTWFATFCTGITPLASVGLLAAKADPADQAANKALAGPIGEAGVAMSNAATTLASAPVPTFDGGDKFASSVVPKIQKLGAAFTTISGKIAAADGTGIADLETAVKGNNPAMDLSGLPANVQAGFNAIPECMALQG